MWDPGVLTSMATQTLLAGAGSVQLACGYCWGLIKWLFFAKLAEPREERPLQAAQSPLPYVTVYPLPCARPW